MSFDSEQKKLDEAFGRAIDAAKKTAVGPEGEFVYGSLSGKQIAKAEPALRRHITKVFAKHYKKTGNEADAWNTTLDEVGGPMARDMPMPSYLRRMITGTLMPLVQRGVVRRTAKKAGKKIVMEVRSLDAWRDPEGGWYENDSRHAGTLELPPHYSNREVLKAMREQGYLSASSAGKAAVEDQGTDPTYLWIVDKGDRQPAFAVTEKYEDET